MESYYEGAQEVQEAYSIEDLNGYLKAGWTLKHGPFSKIISTATEKGIMTHSTAIFYVYRIGAAQRPPAPAAGPEPATKPASTTAPTLENAVVNALGDLFGEEVHILKEGREVRMDYKQTDEAKEKWRKINDVLKVLKFEWISDKKDSRWELKTK